jgi:trehalose synthase
MDGEPLLSDDFRLVTVADYEPLVGAETVQRILAKARALCDLHIVNINSSFYGCARRSIRMDS